MVNRAVFSSTASQVTFGPGNNAAGVQNAASATYRPKADLVWSKLPPNRATGANPANQNRVQRPLSDPAILINPEPPDILHTKPTGAASTCDAVISM